MLPQMTSLDLELWEERRHSQELRAERDALATNLRQALEALEVMKRQQEEQTREVGWKAQAPATTPRHAPARPN